MAGSNDLHPRLIFEVFMIDFQNPNNNGKWQCLPCHTWNENEKTRCSFCSRPRQESEKIAENAPNPDDKLRQQVHQIIEKMDGRALRRLFNWLEDNIL